MAVVAAAPLFLESRPASAAACSPAGCSVRAQAADGARQGASDDEAISAAMDAARTHESRTVLFPPGKYLVSKAIRISGEREELHFKGASREGTILEVVPGSRLGGVFDVARKGGFANLVVSISDLSIAYPEGFVGQGHGVRVGDGWTEGRLDVRNVRIDRAPFYGIGIQNGAPDKLSANNVTISDVIISRSGSDAIDTKRPPTGNSGLKISNTVIDGFGSADERSAAGIDISYDNFSIRNVSISGEQCISTQAAKTRAEQSCAGQGAEREQCLQEARSCNVGIRFRQRGNYAASHGVVADTKIRGMVYAIFFEGKKALNKDITLRNIDARGFRSAGIYLRGEQNSIEGACLRGGSDSEWQGIVFGSPPGASAGKKMVGRNVGQDGAACRAE